jgi:hypothetical protein
MLTRVQIGHTRLTQGHFLREDLTTFCNTAVYTLRLTSASIMQRYEVLLSTLRLPFVIQGLPDPFNLTEDLMSFCN